MPLIEAIASPGSNPNSSAMDSGITALILAGRIDSSLISLG